MPKVTEKKFTCVLLKEIRPGTWRVDYRDPLTRKRSRILLPVSSFKDAEKEAKAINDRVGSGKGFSGRIRGSVGHTVKDAVKEAIKHSGANEVTRGDYGYRFNAFNEYLTENTPGVQSWGDVTEKVIENYLEHSRRKGVSHDTIRLRLYVLRLTSSYMSRTYPGHYRHVTVNIKLRRHDPPKAELEVENAILTPSQLRGLLTWLAENRPVVHLWALLQGCAGVREKEGCYLREQDIDPEAGTITITASSAHRPKNRPSYRTIPVAPAVSKALTAWIQDLKVRHNEGYIFMPTRAIGGRQGALSDAARVGALTPSRIVALWAEAMDAAKLAGVKLAPLFVPRKLRASFVTALRGVGADLADLQAYIGHAPATILSAHYDKTDLGRLKKIADLGQQLFEGSGAFKEAEETENKKAGLGT